MARIHGSKGSVEMDPTGGALTVAVASLNSWTLEMNRDRVDVTAFGDTFKQWVQGLPNIAGSITGWYENTELDIFDVAQGDTAVTLKLIPSTLAPTHFWTGPAYLDASVNVTATGAVSISSTYVGAGDWTREPVVLLDTLRERGTEPPPAAPR